uniref:Uncharacterized protein n=1 Tax=Anguilla anguilla TaxID=7936 RepID=A0A0E9WGE5_ANGAN
MDQLGDDLNILLCTDILDEDSFKLSSRRKTRPLWPAPQHKRRSCNSSEDSFYDPS